MKPEQLPALIRASVGLALLGLLSGCANGPGWGAWSKRPTGPEVAAVLARTKDTQIATQQVDATEPTSEVATRHR